MLRIFLASRTIVLAFVLLALTFALSAPTPHAYAAGLVVNSLLDNTTSGDGKCTVREAIQSANNAGNGDCGSDSSGDDTITFSVSGTITLGSTLPAIVLGQGTLTIDGTGQNVTISGNNLVRVFFVNPGANLTLENVTIANGGVFDGGGGGIVNEGTLNVTTSTFANNSASGAGAIGGGIVNYGTLNVTNSTFTYNSAIGLFGGGSGGGIYNSGTLAVTNGTFANNSGGVGGGIYNVDGIVTLRNTIVGNSPSGGNCFNHFGSLTADSSNMADDNTCDSAIQKTFAQIKLGALANNGGPTQTMALGAGSAAIDAGNDTTCSNAVGSPNYGAGGNDQRGVTRPQGPHCDIGAYEANPTQTGPNFLVNTTADTDDGSCDVLGQGIGNKDCTLREAINAANAISSNDTITFNVSGKITLGSTLPAIVSGQGTLTIDGTGQSITVSGNNTVQVMVVNGGANLTLQNVTIANGNAGGGTGGGGIFNGNGSTLNVTNSAFSNNTCIDCGFGGGGIVNFGTLTVTNSTFSNNTCDHCNGGGILTFGTATVTNSTFANNSASGASSGGGINNEGAVTLRNTIIANSPSGGNCNNLMGTLTADSSNLADDNTCDSATQKTFAQINLAALANNSGPTQTMALGAGSAAIDLGNGTNCAASVGSPNFGAGGKDQRGLPRGLKLNGACDSGAFEVQPTQTGPNFIVNTTADTDDGVCDLLGQGIGNKDCTLREAINAANAVSTNDTITFSVSGTITLGSTLPNIVSGQGTLTIDGTGQSITVSGNNSVRVFVVNAGATLTLQNLTIANGNSGNFGGGIENFGTLTVTNSTFSGNSTRYAGGGIGNFGTLTVTNSTFSGNSARDAGGGIGNTGTLTVTNSTFSGNSARDAGGGIYNGGTLSVTKSTFSGNRAGSDGGGIDNDDTLTVTNSTFFSNNAGTGGGIGNFGTVALKNTIVGNSTSGGNCFGTIADDGGNLVFGDSTCPGINADPKLAALANNGGPTQTMALGAGSAAIDAAVDANCPSTDQRGIARPKGIHCDIGAFEYGEFIVNSVADTDDGSCDLLGQGTGNKDCTLREAINAANSYNSFSNNAGATINLATNATYALTVVDNSPPEGANGLPIITSNITINAKGSSIGRSGAVSIVLRIFEINSLGALTLNNAMISNGLASVSGGAILNLDGMLTINNTTLSFNRANGGGTSSPRRTPRGITPSGGGAIYTTGTVNILASTFNNNSSTNGGAIDNGGTLILTNSTLTANTASSLGGAIFNGAVALTAINDTLAADSAASGGEIYVGGGAVKVINSIVAISPSGGNCAGDAITDSGNNLDSASSCGFSPGNNSRNNADPKLGKLANNGGATKTMALPFGSAAIDAGNNAICAASPVNNVDQRGVTRPLGPRCDIGAYEGSSNIIFVPLIVR